MRQEKTPPYEGPEVVDYGNLRELTDGPGTASDVGASLSLGPAQVDVRVNLSFSS